MLLRNVGAVLLTVLLCSCGESELARHCREVRQTAQVAWPGPDDAKRHAITALDSLKDPALADSVLVLFGSIDTAIRGYAVYQHQLIHRLADPRSPGSLKVLARIFTHYPVRDPSCCQELRNLFYLTPESLMKLASAYFTKGGDGASVGSFEHLPALFPELARTLGRVDHLDRVIIDLIGTGLRNGALKGEELRPARPDLLRLQALLGQRPVPDDEYATGDLERRREELRGLLDAIR